MKSKWNSLAIEVMDSLSPEEREGSIAYMEQRVIPAGEVLPWAGITRSFDEPVVIAFTTSVSGLSWKITAKIDAVIVEAIIPGIVGNLRTAKYRTITRGKSKRILKVKLDVIPLVIISSSAWGSIFPWNLNPTRK